MNDVDDEYELLDILQYQSGCASISYHDPNHPTLAGHTAYICTQEQLDKFAELIIQECIRCCDDVDVIQKHYLKYHMDMELGDAQCIEVIKKHFGIE